MLLVIKEKNIDLVPMQLKAFQTLRSFLSEAVPRNRVGNWNPECIRLKSSSILNISISVKSELFR